MKHLSFFFFHFSINYHWPISCFLSRALSLSFPCRFDPKHKLCIHHMHVVRVSLLQMKRIKTHNNGIELSVERECNIKIQTQKHTTYIQRVEQKKMHTRSMHVDVYLSSKMNVCFCEFVCTFSFWLQYHTIPTKTHTQIDFGWPHLMICRFHSDRDLINLNSIRYDIFTWIYMFVCKMCNNCNLSVNLYAPFSRHYYRLKATAWSTLQVLLNRRMTKVIYIFLEGNEKKMVFYIVSVP